jgi:hypothetical protein
MSNFFARNTFPTSNFLDDNHRTYPNFLQMLNFFDKGWMSLNWRHATGREPSSSDYQSIALPLHHTYLLNNCFKLKLLMGRKRDSSFLKTKRSAAFLNPWPTLHHNVIICMGLFIYKTSLFLASIYKFFCKNEGGCCPFLNVEFVLHWQWIPYSVVHTDLLDCSNVKLSHSITKLKKMTWVYKKRILT